MSWGTGLREVETEHLKKLLGLVHREEIDCPLTIVELTRCGLQFLHSDLALLRGLDARAVRAVLVGVLGERSDAPRRPKW